MSLALNCGKLSCPPCLASREQARVRARLVARSWSHCCCHSWSRLLPGRELIELPLAVVHRFPIGLRKRKLLGHAKIFILHPDSFTFVSNRSDLCGRCEACHCRADGTTPAFAGYTASIECIFAWRGPRVRDTLLVFCPLTRS